MLQGVEAVEGEFGDFLAGSPDPEDAAGVLRALLAGEQIMGEPSVAAGHVPECPTAPTAPYVPSGRAASQSGVSCSVEQHGDDGGQQRRDGRAGHAEEEHRVGHAVSWHSGRRVSLK